LSIYIPKTQGRFVPTLSKKYNQKENDFKTETKFVRDTFTLAGRWGKTYPALIVFSVLHILEMFYCSFNIEQMLREISTLFFLTGRQTPWCSQKK